MQKEKSAQEQKCCCSCDCEPAAEPGKLPHYIAGKLQTVAGAVDILTPRLIWRDKCGHFLSRVSGLRMKYTVKPGLYAVGTPGKAAPVLISANYKMSFDLLRSSVTGLDAWILVLDTKGINVWCAAGKGTFGTDELAARIESCQLSEVINHKKIIVPQLGAPGIAAGEIQKKTGFRVVYGPVLAADLPEFIQNNNTATPEMRRIRFPFWDRMVLTPLEIVPAFKRVFWLLAFFVLISGIRNQQYDYAGMMAYSIPLVVSALASLLGGAFLTPVVLPFIPFRSFAIKGWLVGVLVQAGLIHASGLFADAGVLLISMSYLFFPLLTSYIALQFTGSTTFTGMSGVKKELKYSMPVYISLSVVSLILLSIHTVMHWRGI